MRIAGTIRAAVYTGIIACVCVAACGVMIVYAPDQPIENALLPAEIVSAANSQQRVYGYARYPETVLYFRGETDDLNVFLKNVAGVANARLRAAFVSDPGIARKFGFIAKYGGASDADTVRFDWELRVEKLVAVSETQSAEPSEQWLVTVVIPSVGGVRLDEIELPIVYHAAVGGRVARFVDAHNKRREACLGSPQLTDNEPTTMGALKTGWAGQDE